MPLSAIDYLPPGAAVDLDNCHREPIHTPGAIQSHGVLLAAAGEELTVVQVSANAEELFGCAADALAGASLAGLLGEDLVLELVSRAARAETPELRPVRAEVEGTMLDAFAYRDGAFVLVVELELLGEGESLSFEAFQDEVTSAIGAVQDASATESLLQTAAQVVRDLTGFDRVWVYRFEPDDHGVIVAEAKPERMPGFLGLHYPAGDIPAQARAMFLRKRLRLIPDVHAEPSPLVPLENPVSGAWLDLSPGVLRAVSPMHIEYLKNMGVTASMSIALTVDDRLWGLISAHAYSGARMVAHRTRAACELLGLVCSMQLAAYAQVQAGAERLLLGEHRSALLNEVAAAPSIAQGLVGDEADLLGVCGADGAAVSIADELLLCGQTPSADQVLSLIEDLRTMESAEIFGTSSLASELPKHAGLSNAASGVIAAPLSHRHGNYVLWFRGERSHTVKWGGARPLPSKTRLAPEGSYEAWADSVKATSRPWSPAEVESVTELRSSVGTFLLSRAEQLAALNAELARSNAELDAFAYMAAHDLKEPLRGIHNYASLLIEDYDDALDEGAHEQMNTVLRLAQRMGGLLDSLLEHSRVGHAELRIDDMTLEQLVDDAREMLHARLAEPGVELVLVSPERRLHGDRSALAQVLANLISNALKYNDAGTSTVEISCVPLSQTRRGAAMDAGARPDRVAVCVRDNGIGIASEKQEAVFTVFRRLHARDAYGGGTGAGLTIARRIVERHGGELWIDDSAPGVGSCFCFTVEGSL